LPFTVYGSSKCAERGEQREHVKPLKVKLEADARHASVIKTVETNGQAYTH